MTPRADRRNLELRDYFAVIRRRRWTILAVVVVVVVVSVALSLRQEKLYRASAEVLLEERASEQIFSPDNSNSQVAQRTQAAIQTQIQLMRSRSVQATVLRALGHLPAVSISAEGLTTVIRITATAGQPGAAARDANAYAKGYIETRRKQTVDDLLAAGDQVQAKVDEIDRQLTSLDEPINALDAQIRSSTGEERLRLEQDQQRRRDDASAERQALQTQRANYSAQLSQLELAGRLTQTGGAQLVSDAIAPGVPFQPTPRRNAVLALVLGLVLGAGAALLREYLDESIKSKEDVERATDGLTVVGMIPLLGGWRDASRPQLVSLADPSSPAAESYRTLRTSVQFLSLDHPLKVLQITSATASEGKTTTLANLAVTFASTGLRVVAVCCDLRRPRLHEYFDLESRVGFTSVLLGEVGLGEALQAVPGQPNLSVLASGPPPPNPAELLSSTRVKGLFADLRASADLILIDSPPILPVTDGQILAGLADATLVVATANKTGRKDLHRAIELLRQVNAPLAGAVLNSVDASNSYGYSHGYGYGYSYGSG